VSIQLGPGRMSPAVCRISVSTAGMGGSVIVHVGLDKDLTAGKKSVWLCTETHSFVIIIKNRSRGQA
jgi:hypothetical protein